MFKETIHLLFNYLKTVNVYVTTNEDTVEERREQIIFTRVFIGIFIVSSIGLVAYASLSLQLITVRLENPSQSTVERLQSKYPDTLVCPCSQTSIQVKKFVNVNVSYHQVNYVHFTSFAKNPFFIF